MLEKVLSRCLQGIPATVEEALEISRNYDLSTICDAAHKIRKERCGVPVDTCSIVNARAGMCGEDCRWCSQSRHWKAAQGLERYEFVDRGEWTSLARAAEEAGVMRFSLVTSGRKVSKTDVSRFAEIYRELGRMSPMSLCASMGLIDKESMEILYDAGVRRYHCNLETSARFFPTLCTTHSREDKLKTIEAAKSVGMVVCSGGIIGMGETLEDRLMMAEECREAGAVSIPVNLLNPIKDTPLESTPLLSEEEIILTVALMRFIAPDTVMRFAGGRKRLSREATLRILHGGMNGVMIGDLLTTKGNEASDDVLLISEAEGEA